VTLVRFRRVGVPAWGPDPAGSVSTKNPSRRAAARGLPTLTDKGYAGAGIGIIVPAKGADLATDNLTAMP
jgi:hypothetical protein